MEFSARARAALIVALFALPTLWLGVLGARLPIDVANVALKSVGTPEASAQRLRVEQFGPDADVFLVFQALPIGQGRIQPLELRALDELRASLEALEGVAAVQSAPARNADSRVWSVRLSAGAAGWTEAVEQIEQRVADEAPATLRASLSGLPLAELVLARELAAEQRRVVPAVALTLVALLFALYRSAGLVLAILAPPGCAIAWIGGLQHLLGRELTPVSVLLAPVMLTVGVAAGVHWIEAYLDQLDAGRAAPDAAHGALRSLREPALLAALTTVIGMAALVGNEIPAVADFAAFAAVGVALTYAAANWLTPALLILAGPRSSARWRARGAWSRALGARVVDRLVEHAPAIRTGALMAAIAGLALCARLEVDNDPLRVLPGEHPFRRQHAAVAAELGGAEVFDVLAPVGSKLAEPVAAALFAAALCELDGVVAPAGPPLVSARGDWLSRFVLAPSGSGAREALFERVEQRARALGAPECVVTGAAVQVARDSGRMIRGALVGALASLVLLWLVFWAGLRSVRYASLALVPNALPCVVVNAALVLWGAPLSFATAIISSTMLGLIVDDTIHLLHRFRELRSRAFTPLAALEQVYRSGARAVVITSLVLAVGFGAGAVGKLATSVEFGALAALTIVTAFFADLILLPAILVRTSTSAVEREHSGPAASTP